MTTRMALSKDLDAVVHILNQSILRGNENGRLATVKASELHDWFFEHSPSRYPLLVTEEQGEVVGWLSLGAYRPGREALRRTAEISYYVRQRKKRQGIGSTLMKEALRICPCLGIKVLVAFLLEHNSGSIALLRKFGFERWGLFPQAAYIGGKLVGQLCYGKLLEKADRV
ncbi:MAG: N-acetyltransferase [Candidatus Zixiibacteriota bacterium]|nr:MAG: N-acetyltransferase [candidate division Zixibacteria bacterium]